MLKKFIAINNAGRAIFYIYIYDFMGTRIQDSNLPNLDRYRQLKAPLAILLNPESTDEAIEFAGNELIEKVKKIDDLRRYYLPLHAIDNNGKFIESNYNPLLDERLDRNAIKVKSFTPYSAKTHPKSFTNIVKDRILTGLNLDHGVRLRRINKSSFESKLQNSSLMDCYLDNFSQKLIYYHYSSDSERALLMQSDSEIKMVFFSWLIEEEMEKLLKNM